MQHSEIEHSALQSIATASPKATDNENTQWRVMTCIRACKGDHTAGLMLSQLLYWWPRKYACHKGIKKSASDWDAELMLGEKPVKRINKLLTGLGFVEIYQAPWGHFKSDSTFYVLTEKALALDKAPLPTGGMVTDKAPLPDGGVPDIALLPTGGVVSKAPLPTGGVTENTKNTTENTKPKILKPQTSASPLSAETSTGGSGQSDQAESKPKTKKLKYGKGFDHYVQLQANGHDMHALLAACIEAGFVEHDRSMLADTECSFLLRVEHDLKASVLDDTLEEFVLFAGKEWDCLCSIAEDVAGKALHVPVTSLNRFDFLVKHMSKIFDDAKATKQATTPPTDPAACADAPEPAEPATEPLIESLIYDDTPPPVFDAAEWTRQQIAHAQKAKRVEERLRKMLKEHAQATGKPMLPAQVAALQKQLEAMPI